MMIIARNLSSEVSYLILHKPLRQKCPLENFFVDMMMETAWDWWSSYHSIIASSELSVALYFY